MKRRYKPWPIFKIFAAYWWNPFFWLAVALSLPAGMIAALYQSVKDWFGLINDVIHNYDLK
jgi:hypothetical protein